MSSSKRKEKGTNQKLIPSSYPIYWRKTNKNSNL